MTDEDEIAAARTAERPELGALLAKIAWICHSIRIAAVLYAVWILYLLTAYWTDAAAIKASYGHMLGKDLSGITPWQVAAAFGVNIVLWLFTAAACYSAWRLFTAYLSGSIFTAEAARWLRRVASYGVIAQLLSIAARPLLTIIITLHFPAGEHQRAVAIFFQPNDLLTMLLLLGLLALAHIQKTAAEIHSEFQETV